MSLRRRFTKADCPLSITVAIIHHSLPTLSYHTRRVGRPSTAAGREMTQSGGSLEDFINSCVRPPTKLGGFVCVCTEHRQTTDGDDNREISRPPAVSDG